MMNSMQCEARAPLPKGGFIIGHLLQFRVLKEICLVQSHLSFHHLDLNQMNQSIQHSDYQSLEILCGLEEISHGK